MRPSREEVGMRFLLSEKQNGHDASGECLNYGQGLEVTVV